MPEISRNIPSCVDCKNENKVFCALSQCDRSNISEDKGSNFYHKGQTIFYEGNHAHGLYCIYKGKVKLTKTSESGREQIVRFAQTGELLGYSSLLSGKNYQVTAIALEDCHICHLSKSRMLETMESNFQFSQSVIELLMSDLRFVENRLISSSQKNVLARVAETLVLLRTTFGEKESNKSIDVYLSRAEMAEMTGTTVESFIRSLAQLTKEELIAMDKRSIVIKDVEGLLEVAGIVD
jgi:CRP/FNR family transcriptional regulator